MKNLILPIAAAAFLTASGSALAAKPTSISFQGKGATDAGVNYAEYTVKCSNGKKQTVTAWNGRKKWCVGAASDENCQRKQIKAAKKACKAPKTTKLATTGK